MQLSDLPLISVKFYAAHKNEQIIRCAAVGEAHLFDEQLVFQIVDSVSEANQFVFCYENKVILFCQQ